MKVSELGALVNGWLLSLVLHRRSLASIISQPMSIIAPAQQGASISQAASPLIPPPPFFKRCMTEGLRQISVGLISLWVLLEFFRIRVLSSVVLLRLWFGNFLTILQYLQPVGFFCQREVV